MSALDQILLGVRLLRRHRSIQKALNWHCGTLAILGGMSIVWLLIR